MEEGRSKLWYHNVIKLEAISEGEKRRKKFKLLLVI